MDSKTDRQKYLAGDLSHQEYYKLILDDANLIAGDSELMERVKLSSDKNLNDIQLHIWDGKAYENKKVLDIAFRKHGDFWSLAGGVCAIKELYLNSK